MFYEWHFNIQKLVRLWPQKTSNLIGKTLTEAKFLFSSILHLPLSQEWAHHLPSCLNLKPGITLDSTMLHLYGYHPEPSHCYLLLQPRKSFSQLSLASMLLSPNYIYPKTNLQVTLPLKAPMLPTLLELILFQWPAKAPHDLAPTTCQLHLLPLFLFTIFLYSGPLSASHFEAIMPAVSSAWNTLFSPFLLQECHCPFTTVLEPMSLP